MTEPLPLLFAFMVGNFLGVLLVYAILVPILHFIVRVGDPDKKAGYIILGGALVVTFILWDGGDPLAALPATLSAFTAWWLYRAFLRRRARRA